ncbi:MAG TPA: alpha-hydroxy acid oxidase [Steroidobacteraceae bacterium]|nr:alpha-hydroxy acid oxidase [Steroidobacteraceae bacterium]
MSGAGMEVRNMLRERGGDRRRGLGGRGDVYSLMLAGLAGFAIGALTGAGGSPSGEPNRHTRLAQMNGRPRRRYYTGASRSRAIAIADLRARAHELMPRIALEYLEAGAEDEASMMRERRAFADWRFMPRTLVDVSHRTLRTQLLGKSATMPLIVAPTGFNGLFMHHADLALARAAAEAGVPFVQSTMSNDAVEDVAKVEGLRHWWQLYVFGGDEVWQQLLERVDRAGCEALVLTTNTQIFGNREWSKRTRATQSLPTLPAALDAALHPRWLASTLLAGGGLPEFRNVIEFVPEDRRGLFESAHWIRSQQPTSLSWDTVGRIRQRWKKPFILKGILSEEDVRRAADSGVDAIVLSSHGGRQLDWTISPLDLLPAARKAVGDRMQLYVAGGVRRGTDMLKAMALGADAVMAGRAPLYGLCAYGERGAAHALGILEREAEEALGLLGANSPRALGRQFLVPASHLPDRSGPDGV